MAVKDSRQQNQNQQSASSLGDMGSLIHQSNTAQQQATSAPQQQNVKQGQHMYQQKPSNQSWGWLNQGDLSRIGQSIMPMSEIVARIVRATEEYRDENITKNFDIQVLPIEKEKYAAVDVSAFVVTLSEGKNASVPVAYHVVLVGDSFNGPIVSATKVAGQDCNIYYTAGDCYNGQMLEIATAEVQARYPGQKLLYAEVSELGKGFDYKDGILMTQAVANYLAANRRVIDEYYGIDVKLNLEKNDRQAGISSQVRLKQPTEMDAYNNPIASSIVIETIAQAYNAQPGRPLERAVLARATGFMDLLYDASVNQQQQQGAFFMQQQMQKRPTFVANLVFSDVNPIHIASQSKQAWLLAFFASCAVSQNNYWVEEFRPARNGVLAHDDIGFLGYEIKPNGVHARIDTSNKTDFSDAAFNQLMVENVMPTLAISVDIPDTGAHTWMSGFVEAASNAGVDEAGRIRQNDAKKQIVAALDSMTGGRFSIQYQAKLKAADPSLPDNFVANIMNDTTGTYRFNDYNLFSNLNANRIHVGYYTDNQGKQQPLQAIGTAMAGNFLGGNNENAIRDWTETFNNASVPVELRLSERWKMIEAIVSNPTLTGYATRVNAESAMVIAALEAFSASGFHIQPNALMLDHGLRQRASASYLQSAMVVPSNTGIFNVGTNQGTVAQTGRFGGGFNTGGFNL